MTRTTSEPEAPTLGYLIFFVADVQETLCFWEAAFGCTERFLHESGDYGELDTGATTLAFSSDALMAAQGVTYRENRAEQGPVGAVVSLLTGAPAAMVDRALSHGAVSVKVLEQKPWGQTSAMVRDPNGILVEICTPLEHR